MSEKNEQVVLSESAILVIAGAAHEANAAYCRAIGDDSQLSFAMAPDWQVASAIDGVKFHLANPDAGDDASHNNWMKMKKAEGWKYGETKDPDKKLHPCMVPFDQLPPEQRAKDTLFRSMVHALAPLFEGMENEIAKIPALDEEIAALKRQLRSQKGAATKARRQMVEMVEAAKPRAIKPMETGELADLLVGIDAAEEVVLAFSDGRRELKGIAPRQIWPAMLTAKRGRLHLAAGELLVTGPGGTEPSQVLAGVALLLDGVQVAWSPLERPMTMAPGVTLNLAPSVVF
jgi:hypothetical protein